MPIARVTRRRPAGQRTAVIPVYGHPKPKLRRLCEGRANRRHFYIRPAGASTCATPRSRFGALRSSSWR
jgi:hypothetical protein